MEMELGKRVEVVGLWRREGKDGGEKGEMGMRESSHCRRENREEGKTGSDVGRWWGAKGDGER